MKPHTHKLKSINWQGKQFHVHEYSTRTSFNDGHRHGIRGVTSASSGGLDQHVHYYEGITSFDDGHIHRFSGFTGPAIPLPGGGHIHEFFGTTSFDDGHVHTYYGRTGRGKAL
jgi:hypothetical protein